MCIYIYICIHYVHIYIYSIMCIYAYIYIIIKYIYIYIHHLRSTKKYHCMCIYKCILYICIQTLNSNNSCVVGVMGTRPRCSILPATGYSVPLCWCYFPIVTMGPHIYAVAFTEAWVSQTWSEWLMLSIRKLKQATQTAETWSIHFGFGLTPWHWNTAYCGANYS